MLLVLDGEYPYGADLATDETANAGGAVDFDLILQGDRLYRAGGQAEPTAIAVLGVNLDFSQPETGADAQPMDDRMGSPPAEAQGEPTGDANSVGG